MDPTAIAAVELVSAVLKRRGRLRFPRELCRNPLRLVLPFGAINLLLVADELLSCSNKTIDEPVSITKSQGVVLGGDVGTLVWHTVQEWNSNS